MVKEMSALGMLIGGTDLAGFRQRRAGSGRSHTAGREGQGTPRLYSPQPGLPGGEPTHGHVSVAELETPRRMEILAAGLFALLVFSRQMR